MISVVVASYNYEKYISKTLDSLVHQTMKISEIIVVDDGSTDSSIRVIKSYVKKYPNIKLYQHKDLKNHGLAQSLKLGLEKCSQEYVAFCESDDFWDLEHYEKLIDFIKVNPKATFVSNKVKVINNTNNTKYEEYVDWTNKFLNDHSGKNIFSFEKKCNVIPTFSSVCVKKNELEKCDFNTIIPQYIDFWLWRQLLIKNKLYYASDAITYWRKHEESYDHKQNVTDLKLFLHESDKIISKSRWMYKFKLFLGI